MRCRWWCGKVTSLPVGCFGEPWFADASGALLCHAKPEGFDVLEAIRDGFAAIRAEVRRRRIRDASTPPEVYTYELIADGRPNYDGSVTITPVSKIKCRHKMCEKQGDGTCVWERPNLSMGGIPVTITSGQPLTEETVQKVVSHLLVDLGKVSPKQPVVIGVCGDNLCTDCKTFVCNICSELRPWCVGANDDTPDACNDCVYALGYRDLEHTR